MTDKPETIFDTIESLKELADYIMEEDSESLSTRYENDDVEKTDDEVNDAFHICDQCSFQTDDLEYFTFHVLEEKHQYSCITCSLKVSNPSNIRKHSLRLHGMIKSLNCDNRGFWVFPNIITHTEEKVLLDM